QAGNSSRSLLWIPNKNTSPSAQEEEETRPLLLLVAVRGQEKGNRPPFHPNASGNNKENPSSLLTRPDRKKTVGKPNNPPCSRGQGRQKKTRPGGTGRKRLIHACYTGLKLHLIHH
ncbi:hypothetical protein KI387_008601, partial [Taxus chinensis]